MKLPIALINSLQNIKGFDEQSFLNAHQTAEQITSIRINPFKNINHFNFNCNQNIPWNNFGFYLDKRPSFTIDPLLHAGAYYVQEASSMFLQEVLKQTIDLSQPIKVLDLCAAPGGKSTLIQSIISNNSLLVSNEVIKPRVNISTENITKWGAANVIVTNNDPKDFTQLKNYFDVIVVDAPCSGSGLFRKDEAAIAEWSPNNVQLCFQRQQRILAHIFSSLKEDGVLIYSTCSYSTQENEDIMDWLIDDFNAENLKLNIDNNWNIIETSSFKNNGFGHRFFPDKIKGEGFFIAAFKKPKDKNQIAINAFKSNKTRADKILKEDINVLKSFLQNPNDFYFIKQKDEFIAMPLHVQNDLTLIQSNLYIKKAGVKMGAIIRGELIPHHELALSTILNNTISKIDVDVETALQYLRKQEVDIKTNLKGWALITYQNLGLGWIKILPSRINNYYPKEWRIVNK